MKIKTKYSKGVWLTFLGPDGCGKSSVIQGVMNLIDHDLFSGVEVIHLRPHVGQSINRSNAKSVVENPHEQKKRNKIISVFKIIYFLFDYTLGYFIKVRPLLQDNKLVIFDRYYYDLQVDPLRYRYGGPMWFSQFIGHFIPKPDLVIVLNASAETIQSRKKEVPFEETERQTYEYQGLSETMDNVIIVNAEQTIERVVRDVNDAVLDYMEHRMRSRLG